LTDEDLNRWMALLQVMRQKQKQKQKQMKQMLQMQGQMQRQRQMIVTKVHLAVQAQVVAPIWAN
jgi:hypothetical protein